MTGVRYWKATRAAWRSDIAAVLRVMADIVAVNAGCRT